MATTKTPQKPGKQLTVVERDKIDAKQQQGGASGYVVIPAKTPKKKGGK